MEMLKAAPLGSKSTKGFPVNYKEVQAYCRDITRIVNLSEAFFKECYAKSVQDYANILIYTTKRNLRKYCGKKGSRVVREMLKLAPCANKHVKGNPETAKCYVRYFNQTSQLINIKNDMIKIPHACCYFVEAIKCAEDFMNSIDCLRPHVPMLMDYFRTGTSSISDIMCGEYNDQTDACAKLGPAPAPAKRNTKKYLTPTSLLIDLMESIKDYTPSPNMAGGF